jgi:hypothetical protein
MRGRGGWLRLSEKKAGETTVSHRHGSSAAMAIVGVALVYSCVMGSVCQFHGVFECACVVLKLFSIN